MVATSSQANKPKNTKSYTDTNGVKSSKVLDPTPNVKSSEGSNFVTPVTNSVAFQKAKAAGAAHDKLLIRQGKKAEAVGREAIYQALLFAERFKAKKGSSIDVEALNTFLSEQTGKPVHGGVDNLWQPLAKACSAEGAQRPIVTKRGYVLAVLIEGGISADKLLGLDGAFNQPHVVGAKKKPQTGMAKYISIYKEMQRLAKPASTNPSRGQFGRWTREALAKEAKSFLTALFEEGLLAPEVKRVEDLLAGEAGTA